jgi:putative sterol carrier protein
MKTIQETVSKLESRITDTLAEKINKICLFEIGSNETVEFWTVNFTINSNRIYKGKPTEDVACTIIIKDIDDWFSIIKGDLNPTSAFMNGKVKIKGDISTALKMQTILSN